MAGSWRDMLGLGRRKSDYALRRDERFVVHNLTCAVGAVADLSASGMRARSASKPLVGKGDVERFEICNGRQKLMLTGRVAWIKRTGLRGGWYEIGVQFVDSRPQVRTALEQLARVGHIKAKHAPSQQDARTAVPLQASVQVEDLYQILEIDRHATSEEIRRAYRALAKRYHPDSNPSEDAAEHFAVISKAYRVLSDPDTRRRYDTLLTGQAA